MSYGGENNCRRFREGAEVIKVDWQSVEFFLAALEESVKDYIRESESGCEDGNCECWADRIKHKFGGVYGIPRGGLVLATMISHRMGLPMLMAPCEGCMIVDDIVDSGDTMLPHVGKGYRLVSMYHRKGASCVPDFHWGEKHEGSWIEFPWE